MPIVDLNEQPYSVRGEHGVWFVLRHYDDDSVLAYPEHLPAAFANANAYTLADLTPILEDTMTNQPTALTQALAAIDDLNEKLAALTIRVDTAETQQKQGRADLLSFQERTKELLVELAEEHSFDINEALDALGLERVTRTYKVRVKVFAEQIVEIEVEGTDADDARSQVGDGDHDREIADEVDPYEWEIENSSHQVDEVTEQD